MSTLKVGGIRGVSASSDAITVANDGTATGKFTNRKGKNLVINGAMQVAQRNTSVSSASGGYLTVDRFKYVHNGNDGNLTQSQADVASGTTPYTLGFRKSYKLLNGNQTGGAGTGDRCRLQVNIEAQDIANSGWNYLSPSSYVTLSFWVKSSVAQNFFGSIRTPDGTEQGFSFETGSLVADTWTKVTVKIPGNSNLTFDNDAELGWNMDIAQFIGTDRTSSGHALNQWAAYDSNDVMPDNTGTWYTTDNATWEITGIQLEVGEVATDFEHQCYQYDLYRCYRYYIQRGFEALMGSKSGQVGFPTVQFPVVMRATASVFIQRNGNDHEMRNQNDGSALSGVSTYNQYNYGFASRGSSGSANIIYASTYYADAEL